MGRIENGSVLPDDFLKSLGFPSITVHETFSHFDFTLPGRRVLVIGPMGSGKTEFSARVWRDAAIAQKKSDVIKALTSTNGVDRRKVFFVRSQIDGQRFSEYPTDALAYRNGYIRCGDNIAHIKDSFGLEKILADHPDFGTFIIDEASFFDERIAYVVRNHSIERGILFIFPTLILNFRRDIFNSTARLMLDIATDVIPLTAYCEHPDCMKDAFYTYRYYSIDGKECPALFFDPLIIVGGDTHKDDSLSPNYCSRCDEHHYLPGKEYTFFHLKPLGEKATRGDEKPLREEMFLLKHDVKKSALFQHIDQRYGKRDDGQIFMNALLPGALAEKALIYLFCEQNLIPEDLLVRFAYELELDRAYMTKVLSDNLRPVSFEQPLLSPNLI
ncbi:MAG: thymidine kinase [Spirochaetia bacterium]|nr:thymidine kinase [Spirochaetia bacterium]